ncbi:MAG: hypothetical protein AAFP68_19705 [Pseudomonadota bacterium]
MSAEETFRARRLMAVDLLEMDFLEGIERVCNLAIPLTLPEPDGRVFRPVWRFGLVRYARTTESLEANSVTFGLRRSAEDNSIDYQAFLQASNAERERDILGRSLTHYSLAITENGEIPGDPVPEFVGEMSSIGTRRVGTSEIEILLQCEGYFADGRLPAFGFYTDQDQKMRYPGDRAFEAVPDNAERRIRWPRD